VRDVQGVNVLFVHLHNLAVLTRGSGVLPFLEKTQQHRWIAVGAEFSFADKLDILRLLALRAGNAVPSSARRHGVIG
jgi:hypothetical protein